MKVDASPGGFTLQGSRSVPKGTIFASRKCFALLNSYHHFTVKDACELAERLGVKNLLLYHTEDEEEKDFIRKVMDMMNHPNWFDASYISWLCFQSKIIF